jgi:hypothetical protein
LRFKRAQIHSRISRILLSLFHTLSNRFTIIFITIYRTHTRLRITVSRTYTNKIIVHELFLCVPIFKHSRTNTSRTKFFPICTRSSSSVLERFAISARSFSSIWILLALLKQLAHSDASRFDKALCTVASCLVDCPDWLSSLLRDVPRGMSNEEQRQREREKGLHLQRYVICQVGMLVRRQPSVSMILIDETRPSGSMILIREAKYKSRGTLTVFSTVLHNRPYSEPAVSTSWCMCVCVCQRKGESE